jgi:xanthine/CO dehydrogenase XdhC/CoxF family maturation factor
MKDIGIYRAIVEAADAQRGVALATVLRTRGSVPRHAGSKMIVDPERGLLGTIGGGCGEADVIAAAREVVRSGEPRMVRVELTDAIDSWSPAVCGGVMEILVEPIAGSGSPDAVDASSDAPGRLVAPGTTGVPAAADAPATAGMPDVPGAPDRTTTADAPGTTGVPAAADAPATAGMPDVPGAPDRTATADAPGTTDAPGATDLPGATDVPGATGR